MLQAVPAVLEHFLERTDVGCILITGAGRAFCAGGDVRDGSRRSAEADDVEAPRAAPTAEASGARLALDARMVVMLHESPKVTIAALPGPAVGAGLGIA